MPPILRKIFLVSTLLLLGACGTKMPPAEPPASVENQRVAALAQAIGELGARVDPLEARRAASLAYSYSRQLAREYEISDSPLVHNIKINLGLRDRGLCVHWTRDLTDRLRQEKFRSLDLHWGIANYESLLRIEHSTLIVSARGDGLDHGIVLDPWRNGGELFWSPTLADPDYRWRPWAEIMALKKQVGTDSGDR